jgi:hypothetical protein
MSIKETARKIPGVAAVEGLVTGTLANEQDLPIRDYDAQSASDIASQLKGLSQRERHHSRRQTHRRLATRDGLGPRTARAPTARFRLATAAES